MLECCEIMGKVNSDILSLWFADGTNYAGQDSCGRASAASSDGLPGGLCTCRRAAVC
jgi:L-rhamnose isomerase/sugar isomerase